MKKLLGIMVLGLLWCNVGAANEIDTRSTLLKSDFVVSHQEEGKMTLKFFPDGTGTWQSRRGIFDILWKVLDNRGNFLIGAPHQFDDNAKIGPGSMNLDFKSMTITSHLTVDGKKKRFSYTILSPKQPVYLAEKPEKKKPKQSPDDNKVVAASMGSGFFVTKSGHMVTNYHVIEGCNSVKANILGKEIQADIIAIDKTNDLAIIKAKMNPSKVFPVSNEDVSLMQDVIVAGFPLGKKVSSAIKIHKGSVTALAGFGDNYSNFQTDATINQGNSGGPIMNQKGNVVGVAVQLIAAEHAQNIFFGVKSSTLKTFANANNIKFLTPNYREMSNEDLGKLITDATVFLECWMTVAKIKQMIAQAENTKAFYSEHK